MPKVLRVSCFLTLLGWAALPGVAAGVHVWEKQELTFTAARSFANPYTEVTVWVDLPGPAFKKRVYGFWDGERTFRVRVVATAPGKLDMAQRIDSRGPGTRRQERIVHGRRLDRGTKSSRTRCAAASCARPPTITPWNRPTARRSSSSATPGTPPAPIASSGTTTTRSARWGPTPASRTTCATAKRRAITGSTSSRRFPTG